MDAVGLVEIFAAADAFEQERHERGVILFREFRVKRSELTRVVLTHARGNHHAREHDLDIRIFRANSIDDALEIGARHRGLDTAEAIVATEGEHKDVDRLPKNPVDAAKSACGCFAAESSVDHAIRQMGGLDLLLDARGVCFCRRILQAVTRRQAVAEKDDGFKVGLGGAKRRKHERHETHEKKGKQAARTTRMDGSGPENLRPFGGNGGWKKGSEASEACSIRRSCRE